MAKKKSAEPKRSTLCFHAGCKRAVPGAPGPRHCRDHAGERVAALNAELKALRDAYGEDAKPTKPDKAA